MVSIKCACGSSKYSLVADEDVIGHPPSWTARQFHCEECNGYDWLEADDLGLDSWPEETLAKHSMTA